MIFRVLQRGEAADNLALLQSPPMPFDRRKPINPDNVEGFNAWDPKILQQIDALIALADRKSVVWERV